MIEQDNEPEMIDPQEMLNEVAQDQQAAKHWPDVKSERGIVYGLTDPHGDKMVVMSLESWTDFGTLLEISRKNGREVAAAAQKMKDTIEGLQEELRVLADKHLALRDQLRKSRRAQMDGIMVADTADMKAALSTARGAG